MDFKKLWIEGAVYPAMVLLQHNHVVANTRALQRMETLPAEERAVRTRQRLSELLFLCKTQVPAYSDLPFTDLDIRREPLDCLQAVDPMPLSDFLDEAENHLSRLAQAEKLLRCPVQRGEREISFAMTHEQLECYEAARWRGLGWYGVTFGSRSVLLWDKPRPHFLLEAEPYLKNRLSLSACAMICVTWVSASLRALCRISSPCARMASASAFSASSSSRSLAKRSCRLFMNLATGLYSKRRKTM